MQDYFSELDRDVIHFYQALVQVKPYYPENSVFLFDLDNTLTASFLLPIGSPHSDMKPPITSMVWLYNQIKALPMEIIILSGKHDYDRTYVLENLNLIGVTGYKDLILREPAEYNLEHWKYKSIRRRQLSKIYNILGSASNDVSDFQGFNTGLRFLIPNSPTYIPKNLR